MDSVQQRTPKVAPRRQLRSPQHIASVMQVAASGVHMHCVEVKSQSAQVPRVGPASVPEAHVLLVAQYPHPASAVQSRQVALSAQVSTTGQLLASQLHVVHVPVEGPLEVPALQRPVPAHHPHDEAAVQEAQSVFMPQVSTGPAHSLAIQAHAPVHDPVLGPAESPDRHAPSQNPHPGRAVQVSQFVASAQESTAPEHSLVRHAQSAHAPDAGPVELPTAHVPVVLHQPQG